MIQRYQPSLINHSQSKKFMKSLKTLAIGALAFAALPAAAQITPTTIRIVASNGDRQATQAAISNVLTNWTFRGTSGAAVAGGPVAGATASNFGAWNGTFAGSPVIVKVSFSGALAGIAAVAGNLDQRFVISDGTDAAGSPPNLPNPLTTDQYQVNKADFGFSTNFQSTSPFNNTFEGVTYSPLQEDLVGISPLGFYASPGFPGSPSNLRNGYVPNITTALARQLYQTGAVSLAQFTGDWVNDRNKIVYAINRNTDAGQRFGALLEIGFDTTSNVNAWYPTVTGAQTGANSITYGGSVVSHELWPIGQQAGTFAVPLGSGGYNSGANLAAALTTILSPDAYKGKYTAEGGGTEYLYPNAEAGYYIGYLTPGDANPRVLGTTGVVPPAFQGVALRYNGVENTAANVKNGTYTAWLYNRLLRPQAGLEGIVGDFAEALRQRIATADASQGGGIIIDASVQVERSTDGGQVIPIEGR